MNRRVMRVAAVAVVLASPAAAQTIELMAAPQPFTEIVVKDTRFRARVALGFDRALLLAGTAAERARLRMFPLIGKRRVNSPLLPGGTWTFRGNLYRVEAAGTRGKTTPVGWVDRAIAADAEAIVSVFAIQADRVVVNRPGGGRGTRVTIARGGTEDAQAKVRVGGEELRVSLDLATPETVMNARAYAALAGEGLVARAGSVGFWEPVPGVRLPYERTRVSAGATLAGLPLGRPGVRITQARATELDARARDGTASAEDDDDTIVVTAGAGRRGRAAWVIIGADVLAKCGRIELDRPGRQWVLDCAF